MEGRAELSTETFARTPTTEECKAHGEEGKDNGMSCIVRYMSEPSRNSYVEWDVSNQYRAAMNIRRFSDTIREMPELIIPHRLGADILLMTEEGMHHVHARFEHANQLRLNLVFVLPDHVVQMCMRWDSDNDGVLVSFLRPQHLVHITPSSIVKAAKDGRQVSMEEATGILFDRASAPMKEVLRDPWCLYSLCLVMARLSHDPHPVFRRNVHSSILRGVPSARCFHNLPWGKWAHIVQKIDSFYANPAMA